MALTTGKSDDNSPIEKESFVYSCELTTSKTFDLANPSHTNNELLSDIHLGSPTEQTHEEFRPFSMRENDNAVDSKSKSESVDYHNFNDEITKPKKTKHIHSSSSPEYYNSTAHPTSYLDTLINMLKGNIGCGILAMGDAFKNGGLLLSPVLTLLIAIISVYNQHLLVGCSRVVKKKYKLQHNPEFSETVELSFQSGPPRFQKYSVFFRKSVNCFIIIDQLGLCCIYFSFVSKSIQQVLFWYDIHISAHTSAMITIVPLMISSSVKTLKFIARMSAFANINMTVCLIVILYYCSIDLPPISSRTAVADWNSLPLFFGTTIFAFEGISLILPFEQEMKNSKQFSTTFGVLNVSMSIVTILVILTGFMGYLRFGDAVRGSLTLNLPEDFLLSRVVVLSTMLSIICTYSLQFYVPFKIIWSNMASKFGPFESTLLWESGLRVTLVLVTFVAAVLIPHLSLFVSTLGAVSGTFLALVFPPLCHTAADRGRIGWRTLANGVTLMLGAIAFVTGTYASFSEIRAVFRDQTVAVNATTQT